MQASIGVGKNEQFVIGEYTPKSRSEVSSSDPKKLFSALRERINTPMSSSKHELEVLSKLMEEDESVKKQITEEIRATLPVEVISGTVGEYLYSCLKSEINGNISACVPECVSFLPLSGKTKCDTPSFLRTNNGLTKLNEAKGESANVYSMGDIESLKPEEEEYLRQEGIVEVSIFKRETGSSRYSKSLSVSLPSQSDTRSKSSSRKTVSFSEQTANYERRPTRSRESECEIKHKEKKNTSFYLVVAFVVIVLIVGIVWFFFFRSTASSVGTTHSSASKAATSPLIWDEYE